MNVALYFGSFDPLHIGHISICRYLLKTTGIDQLRLVVSPKNPLKDGSRVSDPQKRLENVRSAVKRARLGRRVTVSDVEFNMPPPLFTLNTLRKLHTEEPGIRFILIIGADNLAIIEKWHKWKELLQDYTVWVYPRHGYDADALCLKYGCQVLRAPMIEISSTQIREAEQRGVDMSGFKA
ncbi:Nicotinate-nucleotide adenylyltransferase [bioreactor metagenome]|uniref:Nicotinate-nucleotide adenylyltransferase n=1 Tax=bioreactor metagenome TaxID=1076179 RepID=A0A644YW75_9ZZZZ|nr:nicotinate (nicotinamide) nucleotide adenylyltransferase [Rikenellaceae bacterium]